ncbi:14-3-3 protein, putative [Plasmodium ovale wallikeri]|uniref:14-3-3 protein, putative n=2 Tax=Plasmodium ovale TaxID=36330 RepID=A0A1A8ZNR6_PLAOA|nr:14-3-3 protein, putative [Plasmodium ovale wallikeri]SBT46044.1 14-3-3 protein, putative [Plasmodium ovale wallikeri]SBT78843.1 14-3-3 protein, putative [Plasmodium ovale]
MKPLEKRARRVVPSSSFVETKQRTVSQNEKSGLFSSGKENYRKTVGGEGKNKLIINVMTVTQTNSENAKGKENLSKTRGQEGKTGAGEVVASKTMAGEIVAGKMTKGENNNRKKEKDGHAKRREKGVHSTHSSVNMNIDKEDFKVNNLSPQLLESYRSNFNANLAKKITNLSKIKNAKKHTEVNKTKTQLENKLREKNSSATYEMRRHCKSKPKVPKIVQTSDNPEQNVCSTIQFNNPRIYSDIDINIENQCEEKVQTDKGENPSIGENAQPTQHEVNVEAVEDIKKKVFRKYKDLFGEHINNMRTIIYSRANEPLQVEMNRENIYNFLKLTYKYANYKSSIAYAILLLLDRLNNPETELEEKEKEDLESAIRAYSYHSAMSYKYAFKAYHNRDERDDMKDGEKSGENGNGKDGQESHAQARKNICRDIGMKIKSQFLLNCEVIINIINCIFYTISEEKKKIYYIYLNANLYKIISDITETGVKYKYEYLAKETYKKAFDLGQMYLPPIDLNFLQLASNYIYFLYFNLGHEKKALTICVDIFDKTSNLLDSIENHEKAEKCLRILSKMRYNIKRWSKKTNKNSILFLTF